MGMAKTLIKEPDSLAWSQADEGPDAQKDLLQQESRQQQGLAAADAHTYNWYSFEPPEARYARKYLTGSIAPLAMTSLGLGILSSTDCKLRLQASLNWNRDLLTSMFEDQLRYGPCVLGMLLPLLGKDPKHKFLHLVPLVAGSYVLADGVVHLLKSHTAVVRPNGAKKHDSFPSQHSSMAFVAATILHHEFGGYSPWISVGGYSMAAWVAYARVAQDYHWTGDVLMGAAIGMLSTHLVYLSYDLLSQLCTKNKLNASPFLTKGGGGLYVTLLF